MTLPSERLLPRLFLILLLAVLALAGWQWRDGAPLSANLMELVPGSTPDALELRAEQRMQEPLNREMLVLVGHADRQQPGHGRATRRAMAGQRAVRKGPVEPAGRPAGVARATAARPPGDALGQGPRATDRPAPTPSSSSGCKRCSTRSPVSAWCRARTTGWA
jgi:hypothetical protein